MSIVGPKFSGFVGTLGVFVVLVGCLSATTALAQGSVGFSVASNGSISDTASGLCVDEMAEVVRLDGRMTIVSSDASSASCVAFSDDPERWADCAFERVPTVALRVETVLARDGYMLDVRYVTASGEVLENRVTVKGELRDLLYRCRMRAAVLVEALFGDVRVADELIAANYLLTGTRQSRRWGVLPRTGDELHVWQQYPDDRVGDFSPRRGGYISSGYGRYTEGRDNRVGDYLPNRSGEYLGPPYLPTETRSHSTSGYYTDEHRMYGHGMGAGYFILGGGERAYYDLRPRRSVPPWSDSPDAPAEAPAAEDPEGRYLESR